MAALDTLVTMAYVTSIAAGGVATAVNGSHLAFGEPAPQPWRVFGYVAGGVDLAWGGAILAVANDRTEGIVVGSVALAVGAASLLTAHFVEREAPRAGVVLVPGGATLTLWTTF